MSEQRRRILLKLSGEFLMGDLGFGIDVKTVDRIASEVKSVHDSGVEVCIVIGGGNILRGATVAEMGMQRSVADGMGMLATVMNCIALQNSLERLDVSVRVLSAIAMPNICELYVSRRALKHLDKGRVVIFAAGSGNPYFTTDTAAVLRALEMNCDLLLKATKVNGVYAQDPEKFPDTEFYKKISYKDVLDKELKVMDQTAIALARDNNMPVVVFSLKEKGNLEKVLAGEGIFSMIS